MFVMHVVDRSNRSAYADVLEDYWRVRHDVYVKTLAWTGLTPEAGREIDQFDTDDTVYLIGLDANRRVVGGSRFNPTVGPHLLSDLFPNLVIGDIPRAPDILEWTRVFVLSDKLARSTQSPAGIVYGAILKFCLARGVKCLTVVCEQHWEARLALLGWSPRRLGPTQKHAGEDIVALLLKVTPEALDLTQGRYGVVAALHGDN